MFMHIVVLRNSEGTSTTSGIDESDVDTTTSARQVADTLESLGHTTESVEITQSDILRVGTLSCDLVFNLVEWSGRERMLGVQVIEELERTHTPFTGSSSWGYKASSDKIMMKQLFDQYNIPTPAWRVYGGNGEFGGILEYPVIVKPAYEHCGIGISQDSLAQSEDDLRVKSDVLLKRFEQPVLAETFIDGDEAYVTVIEKNKQPFVLPPAMFRYNKKDGYVPAMTYEAKWSSDSWEAEQVYWNDAPLLESIQSQIDKSAVDCYTHLGGRSYPRIDMRIRNGSVFVLEINNNPGIGWDEDAGLTHSCQLAGLSYRDLIAGIVENAV